MWLLLPEIGTPVSRVIRVACQIQYQCWIFLAEGAGAGINRTSFTPVFPRNQLPDFLGGFVACFIGTTEGTEMNKLVTGVIAISATLILAGCSTTSTETDSTTTSPIVGKTFKGNWDNSSGAPSTLRVNNNGTVRYCFRGDCTTEKYSGNPDRSFKFTWGTSNFSFKRSGDASLKGTFHSGSNRSTITMSR